MSIPEIFDLTGKVSIVTGAASGIGKAIALGLAQFGSEVVIVDKDYEGARKVAEEIQAAGRKSLPIEVDVTKSNDLLTMVQGAVEKFRRIDVLVNNAGCNIRRPAEQILESEWDKVVDTNLKAVFFCTQAAGRVMIQQKSGKVINIGSVMGVVGSPPYQSVVPYAASKGGVIQMTRAFATEWAKYNILVNAIVPGPVETPLVKEFLADRRIHDAIVRMIPLGRFAKPEELAGPAVFLASKASDYITGHILSVDGGWLAQ